MAQRPSFASRDEMVGALRDSGCRLTRQRLAIIDYLARREDHPSARQIYRALQSRRVRPSLATVYNTLSRLVELGMLREMEFDARDNRFDTNLQPHLNLVCTKCGAISDCDEAPAIPPATILKREGFQPTGFRLEFSGLCFNCRSGACPAGGTSRSRT
jgi:Fur family peroxide stress response transcriptional regulator